MTWTAADGVVVDNFTDGIGATEARTRVATLLVNTGLVIITVCVNDTFRVTVVLRVTNIVTNAGAHWLATPHLALRVETTRRGCTWVDLGSGSHLPLLHHGLSYFLTACVRVALESSRAETYWAVSIDLTERVDTASTGTGVSAACADAGQVTAAVIVHRALRLAAILRVRFAEEAGRTGTHWEIVGRHRTLGVGPTWRRFTWVIRFSNASYLRVALVTLTTSTPQIFATDVAFSILPTHSRTTSGRWHSAASVGVTDKTRTTEAEWTPAGVTERPYTTR